MNYKTIIRKNWFAYIGLLLFGCAKHTASSYSIMQTNEAKMPGDTLAVMVTTIKADPPYKDTLYVIAPNGGAGSYLCQPKRTEGMSTTVSLKQKQLIGKSVFRIQLGSFGNLNGAKKFIARCRARSKDCKQAYIEIVNNSWKVMVGNYPAYEPAMSMRDKLRKQGFNSAVVIKD